MSKPTEYLMPLKLVALLEAANPSLHLLRLFHACYAYVDRSKLLSVGVIAMPGRPGCKALCSDLSLITGSPSAKSNSWIGSAIEAGGWNTLFSQLSIAEDAKVLAFKFSSKVSVSAMRNEKDKVFAMVDSDVLRTISSSKEALFYTRAAMVNKADRPMFYLPGICPETAPWTDNTKKSWLRIAARVGERMDHHYVIMPERDPLTRDIARVKVKAVTPTSRWSPQGLFLRPPCPPVSVVHDGKFRSLSRNELLARHCWTRVIEPYDNGSPRNP